VWGRARSAQHPWAPPLISDRLRRSPPHLFCRQAAAAVPAAAGTDVTAAAAGGAGSWLSVPPPDDTHVTHERALKAGPTIMRDEHVEGMSINKLSCVMHQGGGSAMRQRPPARRHAWRCSTISPLCHLLAWLQEAAVTQGVGYGLWA
jgi:hypothetical protein